MQFFIADTFTDSLARLTADEQKAVKTTAFDLQTNPAHPGLKFHRLDRAKDRSFWSVRAGRDVRLIVHKTDANIILCYVDHHDKAYAWGERRKLTTHPTTGAAQFVEVRETVQEILVPVYVERQEAASVERPLFADLGDDELLGYGVPAEWIDDVRQVNEDQLLSLVDHLPEEAAEALVELATGGVPRVSTPIPDVEPLVHPDAQRRFRVVQDVEELERALDYPWERWMVFLHPAQREMVERDYGGPARVSGSAGTGKTIVALHRAVFLARSNPNARVLLTTYSDALASALRDRLDLLVGNEPRLAERIEVHSIGAVGRRLVSRTRRRRPGRLTRNDRGPARGGIGSDRTAPVSLELSAVRVGTGRGRMAASCLATTTATFAGLGARRASRKNNARFCGRSSRRLRDGSCNRSESPSLGCSVGSQSS